MPARLTDLSEADIETVISKLWASRIWGNKAYQAQKIIEDNGIDKLRDWLKNLMEAENPEDAYSRFLQAIKGLGPASTTELLTYMHPTRCGIWNRQARDALRILEITNTLDPGKYVLKPAEYRNFNRLLQAIAEELRRHGVPADDLLWVDFFLYEVAKSADAGSMKLITLTLTPDTASLGDFDHNEVRDLIAKIGTSLGFDSDTEVKIAHGAKIDVIWRARIANLGIVAYVFEVHRSGSIDSLILNLQKARSAPSVQKVIAVSDQKQLEQVQKECQGLPEEFRRALRFWPVSDVFETGSHLAKVMEMIVTLELIDQVVA